MKRYRNENGKLTISINEIARITAKEAKDYYKHGSIYLNKADNREYVYLISENESPELAHFQSFDGYNLFIPVDILGTFLPDVASEGNEFVFVE